MPETASTPSSRDRSLARSWAYLIPYRGKIALGVTMLLATNAAFIGIPVLLGKITDALGEPNPAQTVPPLAAAMVGFALLTAVTRIGSRTLIFNAARAAEFDLRSKLFRHLLSFEPRFYQDNPTGDVMSRVTNDVQTVRAMWGVGILNVVNTAFAFATVLFMMLRVDPVLTLWAIVPYPILVVLGRTFGRHIFRASRAVQEHLGKLSSSIQQDLTGIAVIKTYTLETTRYEAFRRASEDLLIRNMTLTHLRGLMLPALTALASLSTVAVLWFGGKQVIEGNLSVGSMIEFFSYLARLVWPTMALGWMLSLMQRGIASWTRVDEFLSTEARIVDGPAAPLDIAQIQGLIEVRHLTVQLGDRKVLDDVSVRIEPGEAVALVGRTGSGKSMLVNALARLIEVPASTVFIDGHDITTLPLVNLRHMISYAPQESFLFSASIRANIAYGLGAPGAVADDSEARDRAILRAAHDAGLRRDLDVFPGGLETIVGERGLTLSGGQRQRVALARALAANAPVLLLDDSLSSVDAETEAEILAGLTSHLAGRTSILISHRVAALRRANRIIVLDQGRVVETGSHETLIAQSGLYAEIYQSQLDSAVAEGASLDIAEAKAQA